MMSDEDVTQAEVPSDGVERDHVLQWFAKLANDGGYNIPVTLTLQSGLVTGTIISGEQFVDDLKASFLKRIPDSHVEFITDNMDEIKAAYSADRVVTDQDPHPIFIHLKNAKFLHGPALIPEEGTFWRGRISVIQGFSFGTISKANE